MDRHLNLEEALAHQAAQIDDLSDVVRRQGIEIEALTRKVTLLMQRAAEAEAGEGSLILTDTKPPHY